MKLLAPFAVLLPCLAAWTPAAADETCTVESGAIMTNESDAPWTIMIDIGPADVPLNAPFDARLAICPATASPPARIAVDATMPAHKHGMNYEARMEQTDAGEYEIQNLLFHMPGTWRVEVVAYENDTPHRFFHEVNLQ